MSGTLTKASLVDRVVTRVGLTRREGAELVDALFEQLRLRLDEGEEVKIAGFGTFKVRQKAARLGRNPQTETPMMISGRRVLVFKPSSLLRARLNVDQELR